jgi:type IV pilus assembly protein PilB
MARNVQKRLGDVLFEQGVVTERQINEVLRRREKGEKIGEALIRFGYCTDSQIVDALESSLGIKRVNIQLLFIDESVLKLLDEEFVTKTKIMPINIHGRRIVIATNDPLDFPTIENVRLRTGMNVETVLATKNDIETAISRYYGFSKTLKSLGIDTKTVCKDPSKIADEVQKAFDKTEREIDYVKEIELKKWKRSNELLDKYNRDMTFADAFPEFAKFYDSIVVPAKGRLTKG